MSTQQRIQLLQQDSIDEFFKDGFLTIWEHKFLSNIKVSAENYDLTDKQSSKAESILNKVNMYKDRQEKEKAFKTKQINQDSTQKKDKKRKK